MKIFFYTILGILGVTVVGIGLALIGSALNLITIPWLTFDSKVNMDRGIVTQTYNADNALYNYHWFQETAGEIVTAQQNIDVASSTLAEFRANAGKQSTWGYAEQTEYSNLLTASEGTITYYNGLVNTYNAKAKEADKSMFVNGLPLFFNLN